MKHWPYAILVSLLVPQAPATSHGQTSEPAIEPEYTVELTTKVVGSQIIAGPDDDAFFAKLYPREAATMTGVPRAEKSVVESREFARKFFREAVLEFTEDEATEVRSIVASLDKTFGDRYPLLIRRPWRFIKTRRDLCGSFSFTRADCIVISEPTLASIARSRKHGESLFLHEQMHVLQRQRPELFVSLYQDICGFRQANVRVCSWIDERQVTNPDGIDDNWVFDIKSNQGTTTYWLGTILNGDKPLHRMGRDFNTIALPLQAVGSNYVMTSDADKAPLFTPLTEMTELTSRLPLPPGYDHVNEVGAYLFTSITHPSPRQPKSLSQAAEEVLEKSQVWFAENLKINKKEETDENESGT